MFSVELCTTLYSEAVLSPESRWPDRASAGRTSQPASRRRAFARADDGVTRVVGDISALRDGCRCPTARGCSVSAASWHQRAVRAGRHFAENKAWWLVLLGALGHRVGCFSSDNRAAPTRPTPRGELRDSPVVLHSRPPPPPPPPRSVGRCP